MAKQPDPHSWLIAAWPGMGNVAVLAAGYLIQKTHLKPVAELPPRGHFDVPSVEVKSGVVNTPRLPRSVFFRAPAPEPTGGLTVFLGEAQPSAGAYRFAHELLDKAADFGIDRVVTFASMASQLHPSEQPRVFGAATRSDLLDELRRIEVRPMPEGQISGLNGVLLGACAERGMAGLCLLGEIPFFAAGVANPKAAKAVLDAYSLLAGVEIDLEELARHAETIDRALIEMLERMQEAARQQGEEPPELGESGAEAFQAADAAEPEASEPPEKALDYATRNRIEKLFEQARQDRSKAVRLKQELDRLGVFSQYEDRFLDLFRRAE